MNGEAGDDDIEGSEFLRQRVVQVMRDDADVDTAGEALPQSGKHDWREVQGNRFRRSTRFDYAAQQTPVTATEVENARRMPRHPFKERRFALRAVRYGVCTIQVLHCVIVVRPQITDASSMRRSVDAQRRRVKLEVAASPST